MKSRTAIKFCSLFVIALAVVLVIGLAIPAPSFARSTVIKNACDMPLDLHCRAEHGRQKDVRLAPGEGFKFVYFVDHQINPAEVSVVIRAERVTDGRATERSINLPTSHSVAEITLSNSWFEP
jgi:hypothetical protein